jgi:hypothetical protein
MVDMFAIKIIVCRRAVQNITGRIGNIGIQEGFGPAKAFHLLHEAREVIDMLEDLATQHAIKLFAVRKGVFHIWIR